MPPGTESNPNDERLLGVKLIWLLGALTVAAAALRIYHLGYNLKYRVDQRSVDHIRHHSSTGDWSDGTIGNRQTV